MKTSPFYREHDKIILLQTGQVLTVHADLSYHMDPGIIVKEKVGRLLLVHPAGKTRERLQTGMPVDPRPTVPQSALSDTE